MHKENSKIKSTSKISDKGKRLSRIKFRKSWDYSKKRTNYWKKRKFVEIVRGLMEVLFRLVKF